MYIIAGMKLKPDIHPMSMATINTPRLIRKCINLKILMLRSFIYSIISLTPPELNAQRYQNYNHHNGNKLEIAHTYCFDNLNHYYSPCNRDLLALISSANPMHISLLSLQKDLIPSLFKLFHIS